MIAVAAWLTAAYVTPAADLYVNAATGSDTNSGTSPQTPLRTIQRAADLASPGTVIHIAPGIYRESITPPSGAPGSPIVFCGEGTGQEVIVSGAVPSADLAWTRLLSNSIGLPADVDPTNVFWADISAWSSPPEFLVLEDGTNRLHLPKAREPDWEVTTEWKYHENWWLAESGDSNYLRDTSNDPTGQYTDVQSGHLGWINGLTNSFLTGAVLFATDGLEGHYTYRRIISGHWAESGTVRVASPVSFDDTLPGFGSNTKYFVEGLPQLLDLPGEWCVLTDAHRLYLWPPDGDDPGTLSLEIPRRTVGFELSDCAHVHLQNLVIQDINDANAGYTGQDGAVRLENNSSSTDLLLDRVVIRDCGVGLRISGDGSAGVISNLIIRNCHIGPCEGLGLISLYWPTGPTNPAGIRGVTIQSNEFHYLGFRPRIDMGIGILIESPHQLLFQGNHVHHVMQNGMQLDGGYDTCSLIYGNIFEYCCQGAADCAGLKIWADGSCVRNLLVMRNVFRHNYGWTWAAQQINWWDTSRGRLAGFGAYCDIVSSDAPSTNAVVLFRNESYDNGNAGFYLNRSRRIVLWNNTCLRNPRGIVLADEFSSAMNEGNQALNNLFVLECTNWSAPLPDSGITIHQDPAAAGIVTCDFNLYRCRGYSAAMVHYTNADWEYAVYEDTAAIRSASPWEDHGTDAASNESVVVDEFIPDCNLPLNSAAVDAGTRISSAVTGLIARLEQSLGIEISDDPSWGTNRDSGAHECIPTPFAITNIAEYDGRFSLVWTSVYGALYNVESSTDPATDGWTLQEQVPSDGYSTGWTSPPAALPVHIFRVRLEGPE